MCVVQSRKGWISYVLYAVVHMCVWVVCICMCVVQSREGWISYVLYAVVCVYG